jgi:hypothetical protein
VCIRSVETIKDSCDVVKGAGKTFSKVLSASKG